MSEPSQSTTIVIFGASGDLTQRKLIPALFNLHRKDRLPGVAHIVGFARSPYSHQEFRDRMRDGVQRFAGGLGDGGAWSDFAAKLWYLPGDFSDPDSYRDLRTCLDQQDGGMSNRLYYLATAPTFFAPISERLGALGMAHEDGGWRRLVIEKPFGHDGASARALNQAIHAVFHESQVFRIDHYLGKETAQNLLFFRFGNVLFEPVWNRTYVDHVQITAAETVDVEGRSGYYDRVGVLRDMFQNHLLQLLALTAMEPPVSFDADAIRNEKVKVLSSIQPISPDTVAQYTVRGQYRGYRDAPGVAPGSQTPTYAALRLTVDNWRWQGVPFYLRSGKALAAKSSEILIQFRYPPTAMFPSLACGELRSNRLALCIQPDEGVHQRFTIKVPDIATETRSVDMEFHYADAFGPNAIPDAYERLLLDALRGDASLFTRSDGIELSWRVMDSIIQGWNSPTAPPLATYEPGSWGPVEADTLLAREGRAWQRGCVHQDNGHILVSQR